MRMSNFLLWFEISLKWLISVWNGSSSLKWGQLSHSTVFELRWLSYAWNIIISIRDEMVQFEMAAKSLISIWNEMVQLVQKLSSHSSVFEMRWFSWFKNYHRTHRFLRWDGSIGSQIIIALITIWDEMVQYLGRVLEKRWFRIWNEIEDGSIVFFES